MDDRKRIALIAHDNRKLDLLDWARFNRGTLEDLPRFLEAQARGEGVRYAVAARAGQ